MTEIAPIAERLLASEPLLRGGAFLALLALLLVLQRIRPVRGDGRPAMRQMVNLAIGAIDTLVLRLVFPVLAVGVAGLAAASGIGLFNVVPVPWWLALPISMLLLDLVIYLQHRLLHRIDWLWALHRVHHSDLGFDVTLAVRFHPLEIVLSMAIKFAVIAALGAPPIAVLLFELMLSLGALFTHSDVRLPPRVERVLRRIIVTPDMHRIHHSVRRRETDSNFGFNLSLWDRLFGTYVDAPNDAPETMPIGLERFRSPGEQGLLALLANPFRRGD
jgi:sterol desaturase/sphingolipid hydroxylase (fatty acid hydroxylase superfamily)